MNVVVEHDGRIGISRDMSFNTVVVALFLAVPAFYLYHRITSSETTSASTSSMDSSKSDDEKPKTIMQPARIDLDPPKDDPFTVEQLKEFDGSNAEKPVYVAIKGESNLCLR